MLCHSTNTPGISTHAQIEKWSKPDKMVKIQGTYPYEGHLFKTVGAYLHVHVIQMHSSICLFLRSAVCLLLVMSDVLWSLPFSFIGGWSTV